MVEGFEADDLFDLLVAVQAQDRKAWVAFIDMCNAWKNGGLKAAIEKQAEERDKANRLAEELRALLGMSD
jgi:hypothetical protein